ncbi:hypothetical protein CMUS01_14339 [Colletotrichum musicola]|uniref:Uncharacterized protein n=1 Tax=Colletotrichum musicola TaxID=2175873 RepID=A0A8H6J577_9PEZI|nr:hypothetical protein CMUS01_14339 [Colletotrichum musicola]
MAMRKSRQRRSLWFRWKCRRSTVRQDRSAAEPSGLEQSVCQDVDVVGATARVWGFVGIGELVRILAGVEDEEEMQDDEQHRKPSC